MYSVSSSFLNLLPITCACSHSSIIFTRGANMWKKRGAFARRAVCACVVSTSNPRDSFSSLRLKDSSNPENLSSSKEHEGESDVLVECRDVYESFGENHILTGVSFKIRHGEAVGIIGPSGTGKSTVLKILPDFLHQARVRSTFGEEGDQGWLVMRRYPPFALAWYFRVQHCLIP